MGAAAPVGNSPCIQKHHGGFCNRQGGKVESGHSHGHFIFVVVVRVYERERDGKKD